MKHAFVTGAAGFIGSSLVDRLLLEGIQVTGWDNFSTGQKDFLKSAQENANQTNTKFKMIVGDNLELPALTDAMVGADICFHIAANADVRFGTEHPRRDLEQNTIATYNVLEAMRANKLKKIVFPSTGSVYGETDVIPTPENAPFPVQTSLYGASKLACEGLINAYCEGFKFEGYIFRFVSILGERYTHGHIFDFYKQLLEHPEYLDVLGDGTQKKSYLYIQDCIDAIMRVVKKNIALESKHQVAIYNLGTDEYCQVKDSIGWICDELKLNPELRFSGGNKGWIGDNPFIFLDASKMRKAGAVPQLSIEQSVRKTLQWLRQNPWILERRS